MRGSKSSAGKRGGTGAIRPASAESALANCEIFLCENAQGGRGKSDVKTTFMPEHDETGDKGVWMSIWIENVDAVYQHCVAQELEVAWPPTNMPWGVREMHVRHPDGHVFRLSQAIEEA